MAGVPIKLNALTLRYKGVYDFDGLMLLIIEWMKTRRFWFAESVIKHKVLGPFGAEHERKFEGEKKVTDYYMEKMQVVFHLWDATTVEVIEKGVKKELTKARMEIVISGSLVLDYQGRWDKTPFHRKVREFFHTYVIKNKMETFWADGLYYRLFKLHALIKDFLDMQAKSHEYEGYMGDNV